MAPNARKIIKISIFASIFLFIASYAYLKTANLIGGPIIVVENPENGSVSSESLINIGGVAKNISKISLNDRPINVDEDGNFKEKLLLSYGYNIMELKAEDRFGRKTNKTLEL